MARRFITPPSRGFSISVKQGTKVALDVSVLLAGILDQGSYSNQALTGLKNMTVILSGHVEEMAKRVLRWNAPHLLGDFGDGLIQLSQHCDLVRISTGTRSILPTWAATLSGEDQQVLADTIHADADILLTHDADFFKGNIEKPIIISPSSFLWSTNDPLNMQFDADAWTFLTLFTPYWGSEAMRGRDVEYFIYELPTVARFYYEHKRSAFVFQWFNQGLQQGECHLSFSVEYGSWIFAATAIDVNGAMIFVNERVAETKMLVKPFSYPPRLHLFNSSSGGAGSGVAVRSYRVAGSRLTHKTLRRLCRSASMRLSDGELRFQDFISSTREAMERSTFHT